ncbi:MAG: nucleotidyltransferase family protein [Clostridia bacterium]|nr:nucleotidyltransferase family protein [Clostridia bacterium]
MEKRSVSAIICEFNPLYTGHEKALRFAADNNSSAVVCILSGNFVQRGEPALYDKWLRAEAALRCGADLVIELPLPWAMSGAESFARGGVYLANALQCSRLVFGSECGDISALTAAANYLNSDTFSADLHSAPQEEQILPFAARRELALTRALGKDKAQAVQSPNNTLAVEYCKAIASLGSSLQPVTLQRCGAQHDAGLSEDSASASALRALILDGNFDEAAKYMPHSSAQLLRNQSTASLERLETAVLYRLRIAKPKDFIDIPEVGEGIENRILKAAETAASLDELYTMIKSKRYSHARIRRIVLSFFLGICTPIGLPPYLRVLGMNQTGAELLRNASLPVLTRVSQLHGMPEECRKLFELESAADDIYALAFEKRKAAGNNQRHGIILL